MARVKTAIITRKKHKKILKRAKGYYGAKHYRFRMAKQAVMKSGMYAYVGRKDSGLENKFLICYFFIKSVEKN